MNKDVPKPKKAARSNSFFIPLATVSGLLILFLIYVFWYVSAEDKYYNDRAFRVLAVLSESFAGKTRAIASVLGASTAYRSPVENHAAAEAPKKETKPKSAATVVLNESQPTGGSREEIPTAKTYVSSYLEEFGVLPGQVKPNWTDPCPQPSRQGKLSLLLEDPSQFSLTATYEALGVIPGCKSENAIGYRKISAVVYPQASLHSLYEELNENFYEDILIADGDGQVIYQHNTGGARLTDLNDLVRLRSDGSQVVPPADKADSSESILAKILGDKTQTQAAGSSEGTKPAAPKHGGAFSLISGSANVVDIGLAGVPFRLYLQPSSRTIQEKSGPSRLVFCGLRSTKHAQAETLSLSNTVVIWGVLLLLLVFALGWPLLKVVYVSAKERMPLGQLLALILTILVGTALLTLFTLNWTYTSWQNDISKKHLENLAKQIKGQVHQEMLRALAELDRLSTPSARLPSLINEEQADSWQVPHYFWQFKDSYQNADSSRYPYFRYAVLIDKNAWQRAKFTAESSTPRVNSLTETYFKQLRLCSLDTFVPDPKDPRETAILPRPTPFRLDLSTSPNTGEFLPILSTPYSACEPPTTPTQEMGTPKLDLASPLQQKVLVMKFESLVNPVLPPGFGFAVLNRAGKVQFHSVFRRNLIENFLEETRFNPELMSLLQQGGSDYLRTRYLGRVQLLYITPLESFQNPALSLVVFRDDDRATAGSRAVVLVYGLLALIYVLLLWGTIVGYFLHRILKADYALQGIWPTLLRQGSYIRVGITNFILFLAFLSAYGSLNTDATLFFAVGIGLAAILLPLAELTTLAANWVRLVRAFVFGLLLWMLLSLRPSAHESLFLYLLLFLWLLFLIVALGIALSWRFSRKINSYSKKRIIWKKALKHTYPLAAISLLLSVVVAPCIGFFKFAFEAVERRTVQSDQIELTRQLDLRGNRIHDYYQRIGAPFLEAQRRAELLDRHDLSFFNCLATERAADAGEPFQDSFLEDHLGDLAEKFQSDAYAGLLELERAHTPREFNWQISPDRQPPGAANLCSPRMVLVHEFDHGVARVASAVPLWPGFNSMGAALLVLAILLLLGWLYLVTRRIFLIDWSDAPSLEEIKSSVRIHRSTIIIGHPKSGKSGTARRTSNGFPLDIAKLVVTGRWRLTVPPASAVNADADSSPPSDPAIEGESDLVLAPNPVIIVDHFECGIGDPVLNMKKLELLERLVSVEKRKIIILSSVDPLFYLVSGFPEVVSPEPDNWSASVQILDRWATLLSAFHRAIFEDKSVAIFSNQLRAFQDELEKKNLPKDDPQSLLTVMLIEAVREECNHTASLRRIGYQMLLSRPPLLPDTKESFLRREIMEDVLDRADAYYRSLWSTCTKDERLVLYQLSKDGWANPKNRKAIQDLIRRGLVVKDCGFHVMNRSFRQFILDYQYPEEVAAWDQEVKKGTWRAVRSSLAVAGVVLGIWLVYSQQQVVHLALGYVGALGGAAATVSGLVAALRNRSARSASDVAKTA